MENLYKHQSISGKEIDRIFTNFKRDSAYWKTKTYLETRLNRLEYEWGNLEAGDMEIRQLPDIDQSHAYFVKDFYGQVEKTYQAVVKALTDEWQRLSASCPAPSPTNQQSDIKKLVKMQQTTIASLERMIMKVQAEASNLQSSAYYQQKLQCLKQYWVDICQAHKEIMAGIDEESSIEYSLEQYNELEDQYQAFLIRLQEQLSTFTSPTPTCSSAASTSTYLKLPKITLPVFDGNYLNWVQFKDLFNELIHHQPIGPAQKMFYLKANLSGEASKLIKHLKVSDENYGTAWDLLNQRYNNTRLLVSALLNKFLSQPSLSHESAEDLKQLHDVTVECLEAVKNLKVNITQWDPLVLHIFIQKLDKESHRLYERSLEKPREIQCLQSFLECLETRFQTLESLRPVGGISEAIKEDKDTKNCNITTNLTVQNIVSQRCDS